MTHENDTYNDTSLEELISLVRLIRTKGIGPVNVRKFLSHFTTAREAIEHLPEKFKELKRDQSEICTVNMAQKIITNALKRGYNILSCVHDNYPANLRQMPDAPPLLFSMGNLDLLKKKRIAIVGARDASLIGMRLAQRLAHDLSNAGFCVASGLARGIDASAHEGSLEAATLAVQAGGLNICYPRQNEKLQKAIHQKGLAVSEHDIGTYPTARHFPRRNRVLVGLCDAVIAIEATSGSGTMITAHAALELGREVMAVPGHPFDARASGANMLIRDGACLIRSAQDVLDMIEPHQTPVRPPDVEKNCDHSFSQKEGGSQKMITDKAETDFLKTLTATPAPEEFLIARSHLSRRDALQAISRAELDGSIQRHRGGLISRVA